MSDTHLPPVNTPEAFRYAADVMQALTARSGTDFVDADMVGRSPFSLRKEADRAEAERKARIERLARGIRARYDQCEDATRYPTEHSLANFLDDLGYRLDPTQARTS